ncbi:flagellar filament capping protein FliD [Glaciimonas soli]|uniref:Flagellar hook-associated protein 2 n=1 Tax=Glaciimonas soli TaxID=2590999 RepID=A0A843YPQ1_9BURK|nr:flagellar filament capping protein FliD [Glaciimonas soli]MQQ99437.1 flagellar filament capping protein FliD [Glaciimonas soli]
MSDTGISLPGAGGGFNYADLLDRLTINAAKPLTTLEAQQKSYTAKLSAFGTLQNVLSSFKSSATALSATGLFHKLQISTSGTDVLSASIGTGAVAGTWKVNVKALAAAQALATGTQASSNTSIGEGSVQIALGKLDANGNFVANTDKGGTLNISSPKNTMEDIRDAINKDSKLGVDATIVDNGSGKQLVLTSKESSESSIMKITVTDSGSGTGLSDMLNYDPEAAGASNMKQTVAAKNAEIEVNGITITRPNNNFSDAIPGITLNVTGIGASTVTVRGGNKSEATTAIQGFVTAFNKMQTEFDNLSSFDAAAEDPNNRTKAPLNGDSTLRNIRNQMRTGINGAVLGTIGISIDEKGVMKIDDKKLSDALDKDPAAVAKLFSGSDAEIADKSLDVKPGIANSLIATITDIIDKGMLKNAKAGVESSIKTLEKKHSAMEISIQAEVDRYKAQFSAMDVLMTKMNGTMNYLTQQFEALNSKN